KKQDFPIIGQNMFVNLAKEIAKELNVSNCWVCGGPLGTEVWPWKGMSLGALEIIKLNLTTMTQKAERSEGWILNSITLGQ
ncbi:ENR1 protein, partial [Serilophus lunatus]|nr:ENR1 protein [Serilophus lunatus]NXM70968.1 ENR1 protein [Serilophus lunatus]